MKELVEYSSMTFMSPVAQQQKITKQILTDVLLFTLECDKNGPNISTWEM